MLRDLHLQDCMALYYPVPSTTAGRVPDYRISPDLSNVEGAARAPLSPQARKMLAEQGFAVLPAEGYDSLCQVYLSSGLPRFVTVDAVFDAFRLLGLRTLWEVEKGSLRDELEALLSSLRDVVHSMYRDSSGPVREAAGKVLAFLGVALRLMGVEAEVPEEVRGAVEEECRLVEEASGPAVSPVFGYAEDYRAYVPRGLYASDASMRGYYRARTWLGRMGFPTYAGGGAAPQSKGRDMARRSLLLVAALHAGEVGGRPALQVWDRIYQPLRFLNADSLHLNSLHYTRLMKEVFGERIQLDRLAEDALVDEFISRAAEEQARVLGTVAGLMEEGGPSYHFLECGWGFGTAVFERLTADRVPGRNVPRALDFPAVMGSERAFRILDGYYQETKYQGYRERVLEARGELVSVAPYPARASFQWSWLDASRALLYPCPEGYPRFMRGDAWQDKDLHTFLACWVESCGSAPGETAPVSQRTSGESKGYVEPRPVLFAALAADADMLRRGLSERGLLDDASRGRLDDFYMLATALKDMAEKELDGQPLSAAEQDTLSRIGETLRDLASLPAGGEGGEGQGYPEAGTVVRVYEDPAYGDVLQLALGKPYLCYVVAPVDGRPTLTLGALYSFYELVNPRDKALSEESWRDALSRGERPDPPSWARSFMP